MSILLRGKKSLSQLARAILRSFGPNAHSYPFATRQGAYQTSAGPAAAAVTDPVGMMLDAMGTVGPENISNPDAVPFVAGGSSAPTVATTTYLGQPCKSIAFSLSGAAGYGVANATAPADGGDTAAGVTERIYYKLALSRALLAGEQLQLYDQTRGTYTTVITSANCAAYVAAWGDVYTYSAVAGGGAAATPSFYAAGTWSGGPVTAYIRQVSIAPVTGNHATQTTAVDRPLLAQDAGGRWYASFNGTNSSMALASTLTAVAGTFICCARADVLHWGTLVGNGGNSVSEPGISLITANNGQLRAVFGNGAITNQSVSAVDTYTPGEIFVVSVQWDMSFIKIRKNSGTPVQVANTLGDLTSAMLGSIGRVGPLGGTYFSGSIYDLDAIKGTVTDAQLLVLEKTAAQKAGLVL